MYSILMASFNIGSTHRVLPFSFSRWKLECVRRCTRFQLEYDENSELLALLLLLLLLVVVLLIRLSSLFCIFPVYTNIKQLLCATRHRYRYPMPSITLRRFLIKSRIKCWTNMVHLYANRLIILYHNICH